MLIVNADDFGAARSATDAILETFEAGAISSASAMVWMPDSERAAGLAREHGLAVGLHLNLTLPLQGPGAPPAVAERQLRMTERFEPESWWRGTVRGVRQEEVSQVVGDQLDRFRAQFGEPTHINGHHHVHVMDLVLAALPPGIPVRQAPTTPGAVGRPDARAERISRLFRAPWATLDITSVHPGLGGGGLDLLVELRSHTIEVVTHPQHADQRAALLDPAWQATVSAAGGLGSFSDLG